MTKERMRIEVAKILGAKWYATKGSDLWLSFKDLALKHSSWASLWEGDVYDHDSIVICEDVPNYPEDLNACHEMEGGYPWGNATQWEMYNYALANIAEGRKWDDYCHWSDIGTSTTSASAIQRCEAFLRTLGQWEEDEESPSQ